MCTPFPYLWRTINRKHLILVCPDHTTKHYIIIMKQDKIKIKGLKIKSIIKLTPKGEQTNHSPKGGGYTWVG